MKLSGNLLLFFLKIIKDIETNNFAQLYNNYNLSFLYN